MAPDPRRRNLENHPGGTARARRLPVQLIMRYRPLGEERWRRARTKNVSRSGVIFLTDESLDIGTALEMALRFELDIHNPNAGEAQIMGAVVRSEDLPAETGLHAIAASIDQHELLRAAPRSFSEFDA